MLKSRIAITWVISFILIITMPAFPGLAAADDGLIIHYVEANQNENQLNYDVKVHVSVLDANKKPIPGLEVSNFVIKENSKEVTLDSVQISKNLPISMIILLDISGAMSGRIRSARESISGFINSLGNGNQVGIYTYGKQLEKVVGLSSDMDAVLQSFENSNIVAVDGSACIFDASYKLAELAETLPQGRRVVVLITDSHNTTTSESGCSFYTLDDVIEIANQSEVHTPFYPIGVGTNVDEMGLQRLAARTGGIYHTSVDNQGLGGILDQIYGTLSSEYVLSYTSNSAPGMQSISVAYQNLLGTKSFILPAMPPNVTFTYPEEGQSIKPEVQKVTLNILERGLPFKNLSFAINDLALGIGGNYDSPPYEYLIDFSQYADRDVKLTCTLFDEAGKPLTSKTISIRVMAVGEKPSEIVGVVEEIIDQPQRKEGAILASLDTKQFLVSIGGLILITGLLVFTIRFVVRKKGEGSKKTIGGVEGIDATYDSFSTSGQATATLTILSSDDSIMIGKEYMLFGKDFTIGRSIDSDLALPKDSAVSRKHITLLQRGNNHFLREELKSLPDGTKKPPTYGTYVNDRKISGEVPLHNGDEISLGRRTKIRFESLASSSHINSEGLEDMTIDGYKVPDFELNEDTQDG